MDARREGDENPHSGVVAETTKLLGNSSYGYKIMDRSRHTITKYIGNEKAHIAINEKFFSKTHKAFNVKFLKRLNVVKKDLYEVKL